jgi:hypothetical protein
MGRYLVQVEGIFAKQGCQFPKNHFSKKIGGYILIIGGAD